jgi:hypothetical protein
MLHICCVVAAPAAANARLQACKCAFAGLQNAHLQAPPGAPDQVPRWHPFRTPIWHPILTPRLRTLHAGGEPKWHPFRTPFWLPSAMQKCASARRTFTSSGSPDSAHFRHTGSAHCRGRFCLGRMHTVGGPQCAFAVPGGCALQITIPTLGNAHCKSRSCLGGMRIADHDPAGGERALSVAKHCAFAVGSKCTHFPFYFAHSQNASGAFP